MKRHVAFVTLVFLTQTVPAQDHLGDVYSLRVKDTVVKTVAVDGVGNVKGYDFNVVPTSDLKWPLVKTMMFGVNFSPGTLVLYTKTGQTTWGRYCEWDTRDMRVSGDDGLLLVTGEYLLAASEANTNPYSADALLLLGKYMTPAAQVDHWQLTLPGSELIHTVLSNGNPIKGLVFVVNARADGALPSVSRRTGGVGYTSGFDRYRIYVKQADNRFGLFVDIASDNLTDSLIVFKPGIYLLEAPTAMDTFTYNRSEVLLIGRWVHPGNFGATFDSEMSIKT